MKQIALANSTYRSKSGFSLIELLVVISIIGVLVAIGMASYTNIQQKARDATRRTDIQAIAQAMEQYYQDNNAYPSGSTAMGNESLRLAQANTQNTVPILEKTVQILKKLQPLTIVSVFAAIEDGDIDQTELTPYFSGPFPTTPKDDDTFSFTYNVTADAGGTVFCACAKLEAGGGNAASIGGLGLCSFDSSASEYGEFYCQANRQ